MTDSEEPYISSDKKQVAAAKRREHNEMQAEINDLHATMDTLKGRSFMWQFLAKSGVFKTSYSHNPHMTSFNEGRRSIGLYYMSLLHEHCHDLYQKMEQEHYVTSNKKRK